MLSSFWQWLQEAPSVFWQWLHETTPGQATFLGSVFGFLALLCGAWANASFNRRRDDRLRRLDQRAMAVALKTELAEWIGVLRTFPREHCSTIPIFVGFPALTTRLLPDMVSKLGLLRPATISRVIAAYDAAEHLTWILLRLGGKMEKSTDLRSRWIIVPSEHLSDAVKEIEQTAKVLESAIAELDRYEPLVGRWLRRLTERRATAPVKRTALTIASAGERE
jgi:hypothetical protein